MVETPKMRLFLSHISEEADIAAYLTKRIERDFLNLVKLFASSNITSISAGGEWLTEIKKAMDDAIAMIVLCSKASLQRPWVQFEIGAAWMKGVPIVPICHSGMTVDELKMPLSPLQAVQLGTEHGLRRLYARIASELKLPGPPDLADLKGLLRDIKELERRPGNGLQQYERYIDIVVPAPGRLVSDSIPGETRIESNPESLALFGLEGNVNWTWQDIVGAAVSSPTSLDTSFTNHVPDTRWLVQLQRCIYLASQSKIFHPVQAVYHAERASYQPQLAKRESLPDGSCRFHVHFVETVVAPLKDVQNDFGLIATLLRLGLRFRYEVIERFQGQIRAARKWPKAEVEKLIQQLRGAIEVIENDARSRGSENIDRNSVDALFDHPQDKAEMQSLQDIWDQTRLLLFRKEPLPPLLELDRALAGLREVNYRFMCVATGRYHHMIYSRWGSSEVVNPEYLSNAPPAAAPVWQHPRGAPPSV